ncbi:leucine-rich repeat protein [Clostridium sp.]|uniref:leucine-rich repeat protein n=1 Tax=Clostridium sp. TaxID=1506 RepID=UPI00283BF2DF|nr:leucine-rich repeat protein [Clostridium sp.]MDR3597974.1 leucine-rich repeat protein [Clostridium sp.]
MLKQKKHMIGLLIIALSISFSNYKVALAASDSTSTNFIASRFGSAGKIGVDKNNIKWSYDFCPDGTISIWVNENSNLSGEIEIPEKLDGYTVSSIGEDGLMDCTDITNVKIPTTVKYVGAAAFYGCTSLSNIDIPASVSEIDCMAFENTPWLTNQRNSNPLVVVNNILIDGKSATGDIVIPSNVTTIGDSAFDYSDNSLETNTPSIRSVTIPSGVKKIGNGAFSDCHSLTNINISDTVTEIGDSAFSYTGITSVKIPNNVKHIGKYAFLGCTSLSDIGIPASVSEIGESAFENTPWLTNQRNSDPLVVVNNILIDGRSATGDIVIPSNVTTIGDRAFSYIDIDGSRHYRYGNSISVTSVVIPWGVKNIGNGAFSDCHSLTSINIPATVTEIGDGAFSSFAGDSIDIPNKTVKIGEKISGPNVKINIGSSDVEYGWNKDGDYWYWLWSDGTKLTGWYNEGDNWYYFYGNGQMATEFIDLGDGYSYYLKPDSEGKAAMVTGWQYINGNWFYFNPNADGYKGAMKRACWAYIDGSWYYFYYDGKMAHNTRIDGYYVNSSGAWVK